MPVITVSVAGNPELRHYPSYVKRVSMFLRRIVCACSGYGGAMSGVNARLMQRSRVRAKGFTAIELAVTMAISAVLITLAIVDFSDRVQQGKSEGASEGFIRAAASARSIASQTGNRTVLTCQVRYIFTGWAGRNGHVWQGCVGCREMGSK